MSFWTGLLAFALTAIPLLAAVAVAGSSVLAARRRQGRQQAEAAARQHEAHVGEAARDGVRAVEAAMTRLRAVEAAWPDMKEEAVIAVVHPTTAGILRIHPHQPVRLRLDLEGSSSEGEEGEQEDDSVIALLRVDVAMPEDAVGLSPPAASRLEAGAGDVVTLQPCFVPSATHITVSVERERWPGSALSSEEWAAQVIQPYLDAARTRLARINQTLQYHVNGHVVHFWVCKAVAPSPPTVQDDKAPPFRTMLLHGGGMTKVTVLGKQ